MSLSATPRSVFALADGGVLATGYTSNPSFGAEPAARAVPARHRLATLDPGFASGGVFHDVVLAVQTEVYGFAVHGNNLVTAGYGRDTGDQNDWVSMRFDATTGARDLDLGRRAERRGDHRSVGHDGRRQLPQRDRAAQRQDRAARQHRPGQHAGAGRGVRGADRRPARSTPAYGDGMHIYPFGGGTGGNDQFWGGRCPATTPLIVGYQGGGLDPDRRRSTTTPTA